MSISKTILIGSLGQDPKIGQTNNGKDYANFSIATSKKWKDQQGEKQEKTTWHNISVWGNLVKVCNYLEKGSKIYLEGELDYEKYTDKKDGVEKQSTKIVASVIDIIKGKDKEVDSHNEAKGNGYQPEPKASEAVDDSDDCDIPF
jgi:single-strand DNA-binding protein